MFSCTATNKKNPFDCNMSNHITKQLHILASTSYSEWIWLWSAFIWFNLVTNSFLLLWNQDTFKMCFCIQSFLKDKWEQMAGNCQFISQCLTKNHWHTWVLMHNTPPPPPAPKKPPHGSEKQQQQQKVNPTIKWKQYLMAYFMWAKEENASLISIHPFIPKAQCYTTSMYPEGACWCFCTYKWCIKDI